MSGHLVSPGVAVRYPVRYGKANVQSVVQIEALSNLECQGVPCQHGQYREEHRLGPNRSPKYPWVSAYCPPCSKWTIKMCLCDHESLVGITHSIIPNLNSRLVPIDPIGLVKTLKQLKVWMDRDSDTLSCWRQKLCHIMCSKCQWHLKACNCQWH